MVPEHRSVGNQLKPRLRAKPQTRNSDELVQRSLQTDGADTPPNSEQNRQKQPEQKPKTGGSKNKRQSKIHTPQNKGSGRLKSNRKEQSNVCQIKTYFGGTSMLEQSGSSFRARPLGSTPLWRVSFERSEVGFFWPQAGPGFGPPCNAFAAQDMLNAGNSTPLAQNQRNRRESQERRCSSTCLGTVGLAALEKNS